MSEFRVTLVDSNDDGTIRVTRHEFDTPERAFQFQADYIEAWSKKMQSGRRRSAIMNTPIGDFVTCPTRACPSN